MQPSPASADIPPLSDTLDRLKAQNEERKRNFVPQTPEQKAERQRQLDALDAQDMRSKIGYAVTQLERELGPRYSRDRTELNAYQVYDAKQGAAMKRILGVLAGLKDFVVQGRNLAMFGTVGTGKDHLLAYLLYQATTQGFSCRYANGQELFSRFRGTMDENSRETEKDVLSEFSRPDILALSDPLPPAGNNSDWRREIFYRLIDKRYRAMKGTWITANVTTATADQSFTEPVWDRIQQGAEVIVCDWQSFRERKQ